MGWTRGANRRITVDKNGGSAHSGTGGPREG